VKSKALERHLEAEISGEIYESLKREFTEGE
jgi:hypothetical protein